MLGILNRLNPSQQTANYDEIVALILAICPKLDQQHFVEWMTMCMSSEDARKRFKRIIVKNKKPFSFDLNSSFGWVVLHYSNKHDITSGCEAITKVPCVYTDSRTGETVKEPDGNKDMIPADIRVGDEIKIRSLPKVWWMVHEVRPHRNSILAIRIKQSTHECRLRGREYQEIYPIQLLGCLIRRPVLYMCEEHFPDDCKCARGEKQWCTFQFPKVDPEKAMRRLNEIVDDSSRGSNLFSMGEHYGSDAVEDDHLKKMQRGAYVQLWLDKKKYIIESSKSLDKIHCSLSLCR